MFKSIRFVLKNAKIQAISVIIQKSIISLLIPLNFLLIQQLIDNITQYISYGQNIFNVIKNLILLCVSFLFIALNDFCSNLIQLKLRLKLDDIVSVEIVNKFLKLKYCLFEDKNVSDIVKRMGTTPHKLLTDFFINSISIISTFISLITTSIIFSQVSIYFSILFILIFCPMFYINIKAMQLMDELLNEQSADERKLDYYNGLLGNKSSLFELRIFNAVNYILNKWKTLNKQILKQRIKTTVRSHKYYAISSLLIIIWAIILVITLIINVTKQDISMGLFISLVNSIGIVLNLSQTLSNSFVFISKKYVDIKHLFNFKSLQEIDDYSDMDLETSSELHIVFKDVWFTYPGTQNAVLKGISIEILPGQKVCIVGDNGAGKSTIVKLLCKLYRPDSGEITINGINLDEIPEAYLNKLFSVVFQKFEKYQLPLRDNIALGNLKYINDDEKIINALKMGLSFDLINKLPDGLDTNLGNTDENSVNLSGGEWQRVCISRACLNESNFIILDEPIASLDPIAESKMYESFSGVLNCKGSLIISHRLASARLSDNIYVIKNGVIAEQGTHDSLLNIDGIYNEMYKTQSSWF